LHTGRQTWTVAGFEPGLMWLGPSEHAKLTTATLTNTPLMDPLTHSQLLRLVLAGSIFASLVHGDSKVVGHHAPNRTRPDAVFGLIAHNVRPTQQLEFKRLTQHTTVMSDLDSYIEKKSTTSMHPLTNR